MKDENLKVGLAIFMYWFLCFIIMISFITIGAQIGDIQAQLDDGGQVYAEKLETLTIENTVLLEENENLKESYMDATSDIRAIREILLQIDYEMIQSNPGGVDLWLQTVVQTLEGK